MTLTKKFVAELVGTAMLLASVVGSGIMAERLAGGNIAVALLANSIATGAALVAIILSFGGVPGAHINPVVTLSLATRGDMSWRQVAGHIAGQFIGAFLGVGVAHGMFGLPLFFASHHARSGVPQLFSEAVATFGLLAVVWGCAAQHLATIASAVAAYIAAAYWFTSSTSFANPAVTLARAATDTFTGIRPVDVPGFILAQGIGAVTATALFRWLSSSSSPEKEMTKKKRVLFLCTGNSARSQMAEGLLRNLAGDRFEVCSAGTQPKGMHPRTIDVMQEVSIDANTQTSKDVGQFLNQKFDYVITVCDRAKQHCPIFPGAEPIHWGFDDPADAPPERQMEVFRRIREEITQRLRLFLLSNHD